MVQHNVETITDFVQFVCGYSKRWGLETEEPTIGIINWLSHDCDVEWCRHAKSCHEAQHEFYCALSKMHHENKGMKLIASVAMRIFSVLPN